MGKVITAVLVICCVHQIVSRRTPRTTSQPPATPEQSSPVPSTDASPLPSAPDTWRAPCGLGAALYLVDTFATSPAAALRWTALPLPNRLPPHSVACVLACVACALGLAAGTAAVARGRPWWAVGAVALLGLLWCDGDGAFWCALGAVVYAASQWVALLHAVPACPPARAWTLAWGVYVALTFGSVWTVAYNFVPLGEVLRERTHALFVLALLLLLPGAARMSPAPRGPGPRAQRTVIATCCVLVLLAAAGAAVASHRALPPGIPSPSPALAAPQPALQQTSGTAPTDDGAPTFSAYVDEYVGQ